MDMKFLDEEVIGVDIFFALKKLINLFVEQIKVFIW